MVTISPLAGQPAPNEMLVDAARLEREYYARTFEEDDPGQLVRFGTSGHRRSPLRGSFTEAHIVAITQAIRDYRRGRGIDGPPYTFEQNVNAFVAQAFEHRTFFTRLHQFVLASDAFIVAPGGIGTVLETVMIWQLLQVRHLQDTPLILVGKMWPGLVEWARSSMLGFDSPLASPEDLTIPRCVASADEAIAIVHQHRAKWLHAQSPIERP